jgi:hypothetical protein
LQVRQALKLLWYAWRTLCFLWHNYCSLELLPCRSGDNKPC